MSDGDQFAMYLSQERERELNALREEYIAIKREQQELLKNRFSGELEKIAAPLEDLHRVAEQGKALARKQKHDTRFAEPLDFPEHQHLWTVVEIDNNPVGVTCQLCDKTMQVAKTAHTLSLEQGTQYQVEGAMYDGTMVKGVVEVSQARYVSTPERVEVHFQVMQQKPPVPDLPF